MTARPTLTRMTRILLAVPLAVLFAALATACTNGTSADPGDGEPDAEAFKTEMDAEAKTLLPDLMSTVGGQLNGMQATFRERGGFGIWDYVAAGSISGPESPTTDSLAAAAVTLEDHGFTVEADDAQKRITGSKGDIGVIIEASLLTGESTGLNIRMSNHGAIGEGDDFAESAPSEDYLAFLE